MKVNEGFTPEQIREKQIVENNENRQHHMRKLEHYTDRLIEFLQINKGHIGGISFVVIGAPSDSLYDPEENDGADSIVMQVGVTQTILDSMDRCMRDMIDETGQDIHVFSGMPNRSNMLAEMGVGKGR